MEPVGEHVWRESWDVGDSLRPVTSHYICIVCGQVKGEHSDLCPRTRDWIATEQEKEKKQREEVMSRLRSLVTPAQRLDVNHCEDCVFADMRTLVCRHSDADPENDIIEDWNSPPPEWCPIRGKIVIVRGPLNG